MAFKVVLQQQNFHADEQIAGIKIACLGAPKLRFLHRSASSGIARIQLRGSDVLPQSTLATRAWKLHWAKQTCANRDNGTEQNSWWRSCIYWNTHEHLTKQRWRNMHWNRQVWRRQVDYARLNVLWRSKWRTKGHNIYKLQRYKTSDKQNKSILFFIRFRTNIKHSYSSI